MKKSNKTTELEDALAYQIRVMGLPAPVRELVFHTPRYGEKKHRWRADFAWPSALLLVEVEGGSYGRGRHVRPLGFRADCVKYNVAALYGWTVLRFTSDMIKDGTAVTLIKLYLTNRPVSVMIQEAPVNENAGLFDLESFMR